MQSFSISLGPPQYGWLPFSIRVGNYYLSDEASDLGLNVIDQLINMVVNVSANKEAESYFYLEPAAYILKIETSMNTTLLKVQFVNDFDTSDNQTPVTLYNAKIERREFCNALIQALNGFRQTEFGIDDWPAPENWDLLKGLKYDDRA